MAERERKSERKSDRLKVNCECERVGGIDWPVRGKWVERGRKVRRKGGKWERMEAEVISS